MSKRDIRLFMEEFAKKRNLDPLLAETWYSLAGKGFEQFKVQGGQRKGEEERGGEGRGGEGRGQRQRRGREREERRRKIRGLLIFSVEVSSRLEQTKG